MVLCQWVQASCRSCAGRAARQQHHRLDEAAEVRPLRRPMLRSMKMSSPTGAPKNSKLRAYCDSARVYPRAVCRSPDRARRRPGGGSSHRLFETGRIDVVFGALAARQQFGPRADRGLELFELVARKRMHAPRLTLPPDGACAARDKMSRTVASGIGVGRNARQE